MPTDAARLPRFGMGRSVLRGLICAMAAQQAAAQCVPALAATAVAAGLLFAIGIVGVGWLRPLTRATALFLLLLCGLAIAAGADPMRLPEHLAQAALICAFLFSLQFLRGAVDLHPSLAAVRQRFLLIPRKDRNGGLVVVTAALATVTTVGAMTIPAPLVSQSDAAERALAARLAVRCSALCTLWSPFTVAIATATSLLPLPLWQCVVAGGAVVLLAIAAGAALGDYSIRLPTLRVLLAILAPLFRPVLALTVVVMSLAAATGRSTIGIGLLVIAPLSLLWIATMQRSAPPRVLRRVWSNAESFIDDLVLFSLAITLSGLVLDLPQLASLLGSGAIVSPASLLVIGALMTAGLPMVGIHMVLPATLFLSLWAHLPGLRPMDHIIAATVICSAWTVGSMLGLASIVVLTATRLFNVSRRDLMQGANLRFAPLLLCFAMAAGALLLQL